MPKLPINFYFSPEGYLWYLLPKEIFTSLPTNILVEGKQFSLKEEFHVTVLNMKLIGAEIVKREKVDAQTSYIKILELLSDFLQKEDITFNKFIDDVRLAKREERTSIAIRCKMTGFESFFTLLKEKYGIEVDQPPHVSLYVLGKRAVGIDTHAQMKSYEKLELPTITDALVSHD